MNQDILRNIDIKLYPSEAMLLRTFLINIHKNVFELEGKAYNGHIVLAEWLSTKFGARSVSIEKGSAKVPKRVEIPISVARLLVTEMTTTPIPVELNIILGQLHRQLTNRNFLPS